MTTNAFFLSLLSLLFLAGFTSCRHEEAPAERLPAAQVGAFRAGATDAPQQYTFTGNIEGLRKVTLSTKLMGRITSLPFDIGSSVVTGQVVVRINGGDLSAKRAQVAASALEAKAALGNAERQYERIKSLYATQSASRKELDDTEMMYKMASAKAEAVKEMENEVANALMYSELRAPFDGRIVGRMAEEGDLASPGMPLVTVEDASALMVVAKVPESEISLCRVGDPVLIQVDAAPGDLAGRISQINPSGDPSSRQFTIKVAFRSASSLPELHSGMHASVVLAKGTSPAIFVPASAVTRRGALEGLFVLSDRKTALLRWIRTGKRSGTSLEVLSGLRAGETVLLAGELPLKDGQSVEVRQ